MRLTEAVLQRQIDEHMAECEACERGQYCDGPDRIEAAFDNEVDQRIDEEKERRR
jgi:hypothetical protein